MSILVDQINRAIARSEGLDLRQLGDHARNRTPSELDSDAHLRQRHAFLSDSLGSASESDAFFERIINGNELQDVNYLARGERATKAVARIAIRDASGRQFGWGTGFLIAPNVLITNNHVLPQTQIAARSEAHFEFELDIDGSPLDFLTFGLAPEKLFFTHPALDLTVVAVQSRPQNGAADLARYGYLPMVEALGKISEGEWLTIVQHPRGERKQLCIRENQMLKRDTDVIWYSTDTLGGSSGSPVFNNDWYVVALHHSGVPEEIDGRIQTIHGRDFDPSRDKEEDIKWIANEGIRVSRIVETLRAALPSHPLLGPVFGATPANSRMPAPGPTIAQTLRLPHIGALATALPASTTTRDFPMNSHTGVGTTRAVSLTLNIDSTGAVSIASANSSAAEAYAALEAAKKKAKKPPAFDVPFNAAYNDRAGYDPGFLDPAVKAHQVQLPALNAALQKRAVKLLVVDPFDTKNTHVLKYHNFSVVMDEARRFAIYTAANVDFGGRYDLSRPADVWRLDPRIPTDTQISNFYYASNQFDRGHLTRREDLEFGKSRRDALISAADTCHWTNCTPQHARFNQSKELWQGIERHLLENAITKNDFRAQVITGAILDEDDPVWERFDKIQYPVRFWKVVAAINDSGKLFATAYILDQSAVIDQYGIEAVGEVPFAAFDTYQVKISEVERLTGLSFFSGPATKSTPLSDADPLASPSRRARSSSSRVSRREATSQRPAPEGYVMLESLDAIVDKA